MGECNNAIDHFADQITRYKGSLARASTALSGTASRKQLTGMLGWPAPYRDPFRRLLVHPTVVSRLNTFSGQGFRLDHGPLLIGADVGTEGHYLHGAGMPFSPAVWYHQQNGHMYCRGVTVAWQLADCAAGDGGFGIIPGSHKNCEPTPVGVKSLEDAMGLVVQPEMEAEMCCFLRKQPPTAPYHGREHRNDARFYINMPPVMPHERLDVISLRNNDTGNGSMS